MNKIEIVGRVCRDIDVKLSQNGKAVVRFTVAAQRKYKNNEGKYDSDFIPCICFDKSAEFVEKYFKKGDMIGIIGHMQSGSYEGKNGKVYTLDCYVDEAEFVGGKSSDNAAQNDSKPADDFVNVPADIPEELPFN